MQTITCSTTTTNMPLLVKFTIYENEHILPKGNADFYTSNLMYLMIETNRILSCQ